MTTLFNQDVRSYPAKGLTQQRRGAVMELTLPRVGEYQAIVWTTER